jgi:hypothetical protein
MRLLLLSIHSRGIGNYSQNELKPKHEFDFLGFVGVAAA